MSAALAWKGREAPLVHFHTLFLTVIGMKIPFRKKILFFLQLRTTSRNGKSFLGSSPPSRVSPLKSATVESNLSAWDYYVNGCVDVECSCIIRRHFAFSSANMSRLLNSSYRLNALNLRGLLKEMGTRPREKEKQPVCFDRDWYAV